MQYVYTKTPVSVDRLTMEIQQSSITVAIDVVTAFGAEVTIAFKAALSEVDEDTLDSIVAAHTGEPLSEHVQEIIVTELPEPKPFAAPDYRTKRDATNALVNIAAGESQELDYILPEERYVTGGTLVVKNAEIGDYVSASIVDINSVIPEQYRAALCENWPIVATYIIKAWVEVEDGTITRHAMDTYPLNAKITQGLCLRLTYNAVNSGSTRIACVNYNLTRRLV